MELTFRSEILDDIEKIRLVNEQAFGRKIEADIVDEDHNLPGIPAVDKGVVRLSLHGDFDPRLVAGGGSACR